MLFPAGQSFSLTLTFEKAGKQTVNVAVRGHAIERVLVSFW
jgi:copper(I)-binding protein